MGMTRAERTEQALASIRADMQRVERAYADLPAGLTPALSESAVSAAASMSALAALAEYARERQRGG